jgi:hypothetical protein
MVVAVASWNAAPTITVTLAVDWSLLGFEPKDANITAIAVDGFQPAQQFAVDSAGGVQVAVLATKGWLLDFRKKTH